MSLFLVSHISLVANAVTGLEPPVSTDDVTSVNMLSLSFTSTAVSVLLSVKCVTSAVLDKCSEAPCMMGLTDLFRY